MPAQSLYVSGFDNTVRSRDIAVHFETLVGPVRDVDLPFTTNKHPYGFVLYDDVDMAEKAAQIVNGTSINGRQLKVHFARFNKGTPKKVMNDFRPLNGHALPVTTRDLRNAYPAFLPPDMQDMYGGYAAFANVAYNPRFYGNKYQSHRVSAPYDNGLGFTHDTRRPQPHQQYHQPEQHQHQHQHHQQQQHRAVRPHYGNRQMTFNNQYRNNTYNTKYNNKKRDIYHAEERTEEKRQRIHYSPPQESEQRRSMSPDPRIFRGRSMSRSITPEPLRLGEERITRSVSPERVAEPITRDIVMMDIDYTEELIEDIF